MVHRVVVTSSTRRLVELASDGVGNVGQLLLLLLEVLGGRSGSVLLEPVSGLLDGLQKLFGMLASCQKM